MCRKASLRLFLVVPEVTCRQEQEISERREDEKEPEMKHEGEIKKKDQEKGSELCPTGHLLSTDKRGEIEVLWRRRFLLQTTKSSSNAN